MLAMQVHEDVDDLTGDDEEVLLAEPTVPHDRVQVSFVARHDEEAIATVTEVM